MVTPEFNEFLAVKDFMIEAGQGVPEYPTLPSKDVIKLRMRLIQEELQELLHALDMLYFNPPSNNDELLDRLTDLADGVADANYVINGTAVAFGVQGDEIFDIVHRANMSKVRAKAAAVKVREDGKIMKPEGFVRPNETIRTFLALELDRAMNGGTTDGAG